MIKRFRLKISGASGQGINSIGEIFANALKNTGYKIFAYREYPSLIRGGFASYQIDVSDKELASSESKCDLLVCLDKESYNAYVNTLAKNGVLVHALADLDTSSEDQFIKENNIAVEFINAVELAKQIGGSALFSNVVLTGFVWKILGQNFDIIENEVKDMFGKKKELLEFNLKSLRSGFEKQTSILDKKLSFTKDNNWKGSLIMSGNHALALGAISSGVRAVYSYPMTPATSILSYIAETYHQTGILVKQAEDEITAAQMTFGSMYAGTRALVATSGGGFDLMTETLSLSGITETPFVAVIAQRPGPATGLPTWTSAGDLDLALYSGHGEYPRCIIGISDIYSAYTFIQHAFNIAEKYQIPVLVLTEKQIAESLYNIKSLPENIRIERNLVQGKQLSDLKSEDRYKVTKSGISPRWIPGQTNVTFNINSDEHWVDGRSIEDGAQSKEMIRKRMRKIDSLVEELPDPRYFGDKNASNVIIGWGSVKGAVLDTLSILGEKNKNFGYLHFDYLNPLKTNELVELYKQGKKLILIENNYLGQFGKLIKRETGINIEQKLLKYNGRPFFTDEVINFLNNLK